MALPNTGSLSMTQLATEFSDSAPHSLSEFYRGGGKVPDTPGNAAVPTSGQVAIGNFYGTQNRSAITLTISAQTTNYNLYSTASADPAYVAGSTDVTLNINPGVNVGSNSTGSYSLSVPAQFNPADVVIINNQGVVIGAGGGGGSGGNGGANPGNGGGGGGSAVQISRPVTINNLGTLAGGGGGGGGGGGAYKYGNAGGGGGGGGAGYNAGGGGSYGNPRNSAGGMTQGNSGSSGSINSGGGGGSGTVNAPDSWGGNGGSGGGRGAGGGSGAPGYNPGQPVANGGGGGGAGQYLNGSPFVTWQSTGTRQGGVS